jgi:hypothetical protein
MLVQLQQPLILIFVEIKQESNSLAYWLYLKTLPTTAIDGGRNDEVKNSFLNSFIIFEFVVLSNSGILQGIHRMQKYF